MIEQRWWFYLEIRSCKARREKKVGRAMKLNGRDRRPPIRPRIKRFSLSLERNSSTIREGLVCEERCFERRRESDNGRNTRINMQIRTRIFHASLLLSFVRLPVFLPFTRNNMQDLLYRFDSFHTGHKRVTAEYLSSYCSSKIVISIY